MGWAALCFASFSLSGAFEEVNFLQTARHGVRAEIPPVQHLKWRVQNQSYELLFFSVVPVVGPEGNYMALLHDLWSAQNPGDFTARVLASPLYCSGRNRSHLTQMRVKGWEHETPTTLNFLCDWPDLEREIYLEDAEGQVLGSVRAQERPVHKKYHTAVCVRDLFRESEHDFNAPYKLLPEWLEFGTMHGVDHFFMYTFGDSDPVLSEILEPYVAKGLASLIHFDQYPERRIRHHRAMADCLYRSKEHADWLLPTLDIDEFFHFRQADLFPNRTVPHDYFKSGWDAILRRAGKRFEEVHSILFDLHRFARSAPDQLEISSTLRQEGNNKPFPKYVVNVRNVDGLWVHWPTSWREKTMGLHVPKSWAVANHYRFPTHGTLSDVEKLSIKDDALLQDVPALRRALLHRYGRSRAWDQRPALDEQRAMSTLDLRTFRIAEARQRDEEQRIQAAGGEMAFQQQDAEKLDLFLHKHYVFME